MYFLILLHETPNSAGMEIDHESFVDSLIKRNVILLGGPFSSRGVPGVFAAFVLSCQSHDDAHAIVATDPLITHGVAEATIIPWDLVAINTAAIGADLVVTPDDV